MRGSGGNRASEPVSLGRAGGLRTAPRAPSAATALPAPLPACPGVSSHRCPDAAPVRAGDGQRGWREAASWEMWLHYVLSISYVRGVVRAFLDFHLPPPH